MNTHPQVSFFRKLYLPASEPRTLEEIIILIRIRHWMHEITAYRNALAARNGEGARKLKTQLPGFTSEEIDQALSSAYEGNKGERSVSPATFRTQKDKKDTGTFSGEELRRNTPFLPGDITDHLPPLLGDALRFYTDRRERDMAFLAACTVLRPACPVYGACTTVNGYIPTSIPSRLLRRPTARAVSTTCAIWPTVMPR